MYCNVSHKATASPPFLPKHTFLPSYRLRGEDAIHQWLAVRAQTYWNALGDLNVSVEQELGDVGTGIDRSGGCTAGRLECECRTGIGRCRYRDRQERELYFRET